MGMSEAELMDTTPKAFNAKTDGWLKSEKRRERAEWERARWIATQSMNPHLKRALKPTDLFRFEDEKVAAKIDPKADAEINRIAKKWKPA